MSKKDGKITVKHYLNKRAKSKSINGESFYPLYLQLIVSGHKAQLKSKVQDSLISYKGDTDKFFINQTICNLLSIGYFSDNLLERIESEKIFPIYQLLNDEINILNYIINSGQPFTNKSFSLVNISSSYKLYLKDIQHVLDDGIRKYYLKELNEIFLNSTKNKESKKIFKITNFFIHYINWTNNFCEYYETTYEVLPTEIKFIENFLSKELKLQIKSALTLHSRINFLRRFLDKMEKGLSPNVNIIDWRTSGKEFINKEFTAIFGKQKAKEFIKSIDLILTNEICHPVIVG